MESGSGLGVSSHRLEEPGIDLHPVYTAIGLSTKNGGSYFIKMCTNVGLLLHCYHLAYITILRSLLCVSTSLLHSFSYDYCLSCDI